MFTTLGIIDGVEHQIVWKDGKLSGNDDFVRRIEALDGWYLMQFLIPHAGILHLSDPEAVHHFFKYSSVFDAEPHFIGDVPEEPTGDNIIF